MRAFLSVSDGEFVVMDLDATDSPVVLRSADPQEVFDYLDNAGVVSLQHSSSVDFPEEGGMDPQVVAELDRLMDEAAERRDPEGKLQDIRDLLDAREQVGSEYSDFLIKQIRAIVERR